MAEIFGAVASGAGLVSLSMQLMDSTQKLKGFCDLMRDAPEAVRQLCFDLETMSMALRQFEQYRQNDVSGSELLSRCIVACDQAVAKVKNAVDKIDRLLSRARFAGRVYMGFKEPEVRKLMEEVEHAKSSILLAYTSYCQSWSVRESARHAAALTLQAQRLDMLQTSVESGNLALLGHITTFASQQVASAENPPQLAYEDSHIVGKRPRSKRARNGTEYKFRLALPQRLVKCIWEFSIHECDNAWTFQLKPVNVRPAHTYAFDFVRAGDVSAVRELMRSRQLSVQDQEPNWVGDNRTLLEMAAQNGHLELCRFLLQETSLSADNRVLSSALSEFQITAWYNYQDTDESLLEAVYRLFVGECNLDIDLLEPPTSPYQLAHTKNSFEVVLASQPTPFSDWSLAQKFTAAVEAVGWPADAFALMLLHHDPTEVVTRANEDGKTALHWAATHLGEWLRRASHSDLRSRKVESYANLASSLIRMGADVHALSHEKGGSFDGKPGLPRYDPLISLLRGVDRTLLFPWDRSGMTEAVSCWGQVLVEGGVHLDDYIATENQLLSSDEWSSLGIRSSGVYLGNLTPIKLWITKELTLAAEILEISDVIVWKAQAIHMPGTWPGPGLPLLMDTIIWSPGAMDRCDGFKWVASDTIRVKPQRKKVDALSASGGSDELLHDSIVDAVRERSELTSSHDDHGQVARVLSQEIRSRQSGRRASSAPPLQDRMATSGADWMNRVALMPSGWGFILHKCPLDSRWYKRSEYLRFDDSNSFRRDCLHGRCHELPGFPDERIDAASFEGWFLRNEDYVHVAKQYAQKFCPDRMYIVEETLERATDRARLAMGPKRPADTLRP